MQKMILSAALLTLLVAPAHATKAWVTYGDIRSGCSQHGWRSKDCTWFTDWVLRDVQKTCATQHRSALHDYVTVRIFASKVRDTDDADPALVRGWLMERCSPR